MQAQNKQGFMETVHPYSRKGMNQLLEDPNTDHVDVFQATDEEMERRQAMVGKKFTVKKRYQKTGGNKKSKMNAKQIEEGLKIQERIKSEKESLEQLEKAIKYAESIDREKIGVRCFYNGNDTHLIQFPTNDVFNYFLEQKEKMTQSLKELEQKFEEL